MKSASILLASALGLAAAASAHAVLITSVGFESPYTTGNLSGQQGWTGTSSTQFAVSGAGLGHTYTANTNQTVLNGGSQSFLYTGPTNAVGQVNYSFASTSADTVYLRFTMQFNDPDFSALNTGRFFWIGVGDTRGTATDTTNSAGALMRQGTYQARAVGNDSTTNVTTSSNTAPTYSTAVNTFVLAISKSVAGAGNNYDRVSLFLNPDLSFGSSAPVSGAIASANASISASSLSSLFLRSGSGIDNMQSGESLALDNLALGTAWSDVAVAIPEPSSFAALAGLGMLGFAATRRRVRA